MKKILLLLACISLTELAHARTGIDGGGAMAVVCNGAEGESVQLLDLYEAKALPGIRVFQATGDLLEDYLRLTNNSLRLQGANWTFPTEEADKKLTHMLSLIDWHDDATPLPFLGDQGKSVDLPANCKLQQLAIFFDSTNRMKVDRELWSKLSSLDQAALLKHESYYYNERQNQETTSESTRSYVRQEASAGFSPVLKDAPSNSLKYFSWEASSAKGRSYLAIERVRKNGSEDVVFHFKILSGRVLLVNTNATFKDLIFDVRKADDTVGALLYPKSSSVNKTLKVKIESEHRDDWELQLQFIANKPIEISLLQDGVSQGSFPLRN